MDTKKANLHLPPILLQLGVTTPRSSFLLCNSLLGGVKSMQMAVLWLNTFCNRLVVFDRRNSSHETIEHPDKIGLCNCHEYSDRNFKEISWNNTWLEKCNFSIFVPTVHANVGKNDPENPFFEPFRRRRVARAEENRFRRPLGATSLPRVVL